MKCGNRSTEEIVGFKKLDREAYLHRNKKKWIRWCIYHVICFFLQHIDINKHDWCIHHVSFLIPILSTLGQCQNLEVTLVEYKEEP